VVADVICRLTLDWDNFFGETVRVFVCQSPYPHQQPKGCKRFGVCGCRINTRTDVLSHVALTWRREPTIVSLNKELELRSRARRYVYTFLRRPIPD
jgi:hypothetical protein